MARRSLTVRASKTETGPVIAIAGVTGAVGQEFLRVSLPSGLGRWWGCSLGMHAHGQTDVSHDPTPGPGLKALLQAAPPSPVAMQVLHERNFPYSDIKMLASKRCGFFYFWRRRRRGFWRVWRGEEEPSLPPHVLRVRRCRMIHLHLPTPLLHTCAGLWASSTSMRARPTRWRS